MAIEVGDTLRVALSWLIDGADQIVNVHHFRVNDTGANSDPDDFLADLVANVLTTLYAEVIEYISDNVTGYLVGAYDIDQDLVIAPIDNPIDGGEDAADTTAHQVTALVCLNGPNPRHQGRSYLPPFTEYSIDDNGAWVSAALDQLVYYSAHMLATMDGDEITVQRVISDRGANVVSVPTSAVIVTSPRTQRRRTIGRGS